MQAFEKVVEETFPIIRKDHGYFLRWLYPPVRPVGTRGKCPVFVIVKSELYDIHGWSGKGKAVGIEVKDNTSYHSSLPIVHPDSKGSGLQFHQLEALAALHRDGGESGILWRNGGLIGLLRGTSIENIFTDYMISLKVEEAGKTPARGTRSIGWDKFMPIPENNPEKWFDIWGT